ncbi:MAG: hypothetical protein ACQJCO_08385 [cyanobacterium endosymbiont of Rhopalodia sterrenbergii]
MYPYSSITSSAPITVFVSLFLMYSLGVSSQFFALSLGLAGILSFFLFLQGVHGWTLHPFHRIR